MAQLTPKTLYDLLHIESKKYAVAFGVGDICEHFEVTVIEPLFPLFLPEKTNRIDFEVKWKGGE